MGNVNESQEREDASLFEELTDASRPAFVCETDEAFLDSSLEQDALNADIPIKFFLGPPCDVLEMASTASGISTVEALFEVRETLVEGSERNSCAELPRDDSFPLLESVLPSSFDLLAEPYPSGAEDLDSFESSDISQSNSVELINVENNIHSYIHQRHEVNETSQAEDCSESEILALGVFVQEEHQSKISIDMHNTDEHHFSPASLHPLKAAMPSMAETLDLEAEDNPAIACLEGVTLPLCISDHSLYQSTPKERAAEASFNGQHMSSDAVWQHDSLPDVQMNLLFGFDSSNTIFSSSPLLVQDVSTTGDDTDVTLCTLQIELKLDLLQSNDILDVLFEPNTDSNDLPRVTPAAPIPDCDNTFTASVKSIDKDTMPYQQLAENDLVISSGVQDCDVFTEPESSPEIEVACDALHGPNIDTIIESRSPVGSELLVPLPPSPTPTHHEDSEFIELLVTQRYSPERSPVNSPADTGDHSGLQASTTNPVIGQFGTARVIHNHINSASNLPIASVALENHIDSSTLLPHTEDQPNWAVAPDALVSTKPASSRRSAKHDERRIANIKGKQRKEDVSLKKKAVKFEELPVSLSIEKSGSDDSPYMQTRAPTPSRPSTIGKMRRPRGTSVSMFIDTPAPNTISTKGGHALFRISEPTRTKTSRFHSLPTSDGPVKKEESVEDKIAAIILETRRSRPGKGQTLIRTKTSNAVEVAKSIPEIRISPPSSDVWSNKKDQLYREGRVSWPASEENEQSTARAPLPWRTGIGRALTTHLTAAPTSSTRAWGDVDKRSNADFILKQDLFKGTTLHLGHDDFPLHSFEHDGPVKVNLPTPSKTRNDVQKLQPPAVRKSVSIGNITPQPTFQSSIPVSNKVFANKAVGLEESQLTSLATNVKRPNKVDLQSTNSVSPRTGQTGSFDFPSTTFSRLGHLSEASSQRPIPPQNMHAPQQCTNFTRMLNYPREFNWLNQSGGDYSSTFSQARVPDVTPTFPLQAVGGSHEQMLHQSSRQQMNTQDILNLNHWYVQGQQLRARGHVERTALNRHMSMAFPDQVQRFNHQETVDGWRSGYNMTYPSHLITPVLQNQRRPVYESSLPIDVTQSNQQYSSHRMTEIREKYIVPK